VPQAAHEDFEGRGHAPSALGGVVSVGLVLLGAITTALLFYVYVARNVVVTSNLDVFNATFVESVSVDVEVRVSFVGFSGCVGDVFYPAAIGEADTVPRMVAEGVSYARKTSAYRCAGGDLKLELDFADFKVVNDPRLHFSVAPVCGACAATHTLPHPREPGKAQYTPGTHPFAHAPLNEVLECPPCSVASAQAFTYSVKSTNNYPAVDSLHGRDHNTVSGSEVPALPSQVFRGDTATEVKVQLMPAEYENRRTAKKFRAYRLVFAESAPGSVQGFKGAYPYTGENEAYVEGPHHAHFKADLHGHHRAFPKLEAPADYFRWVKDGSWADAGAANAVKFTLALPLAQNRVHIVVDNAQTFLDLWGAVGGVLSLLFAIFLLAMSYVERTNDKEDPFGAAAAAVVAYYRKQRFELQQRWYPQPESWTMENIGRMQRREMQREGGARSADDAAVANFKDLYARNAILTGAGTAADEVDYGAEIDDSHGHI
jgi:hypothetical protein